MGAEAACCSATTLQTLVKAAGAVGKRVKISLVDA
jgi:hypothetical protein